MHKNKNVPCEYTNIVLVWLWKYGYGSYFPITINFIPCSLNNKL